MTCKFCDESCACHINPPCSFCTSHIECDICGQMVCEDKAIRVEHPNRMINEPIAICPDCAGDADVQ